MKTTQANENVRSEDISDGGTELVTQFFVAPAFAQNKDETVEPVINIRFRSTPSGGNTGIDVVEHSFIINPLDAATMMQQIMLALAHFSGEEMIAFAEVNEFADEYRDFIEKLDASIDQQLDEAAKMVTDDE